MNFIYSLFVFMPMYVSLFWMILLLANQGVKNRAKRFLGTFMLVAVVLYFCHSIYFSNQYLLYLYFDSIYVFAMLSVYPLYYWYIKNLTSDYRCTYKVIISLLPALIMSVAIAIVYVLMDDGLRFVKMYHYKIEGINTDDTLYNVQQKLIVTTKVIFFLQIIWYLTKGLKLIRNYEKRLYEFFSDTEQRNVNWVRWLIIFFTLTGFSSTIANVLGRSVFNDHRLLLLFPVVVFSILIFLLGYMGYMQKYSVYDFEKEQNAHDNFFDQNSELLNVTSDENKKHLKKHLLQLFDDKKIYRKPDLKITDISQMLNTNRTYVSRLINTEFGCSFSFFVNKYRVEEVHRLLSQNNDFDYTLENIADKVGFPSVNTLIRNFKKSYGITPGIFRKLKH